MWIARNLDGSLHLFEEKPDRCDKIGGNFPGNKTKSITPCVWRIKNPYGGFYDTWGYIEVDSSLFPNLKWEDEPIEVSLIEDKELELIKRRSEAWVDSFGYENEH